MHNIITNLLLFSFKLLLLLLLLLLLYLLYNQIIVCFLYSYLYDKRNKQCVIDFCNKEILYNYYKCYLQFSFIKLLSIKLKGM